MTAAKTSTTRRKATKSADSARTAKKAVASPRKSAGRTRKAPAKKAAAKRAPAKKAAAKKATTARKTAPGRRAIGSGAKGSIRKALDAAVREARQGGATFTLEDELRVLLAEKHAAMVDEAGAAGDPAGLVRASDKLLEVIDTLPIRKPEGGGAGDGSSDSGAELRLVLDGPPQVGDTADA